MVEFIDSFTKKFYVKNKDADMLPEDERLFYNCNKTMPVQFAVTCNKWGYSTTGYWSHYFGGVNAFTKEQFERVNGFSNLFFGWGGNLKLTFNT